MTSIRLDNRYYHLTHDVIKWLRESIGHGGYLPVLEDDQNWGLWQVFGNTTIIFRNEKDAALFSLKWIGQDNEGR